jgi:hypothetical protein
MILPLLWPSSSAAATQGRTRAGTLTCTASAGFELVTSMRQRMRCQYVSSWGRVRSYSGVIARFEDNAVPREGRFIRWTVHADRRALARGALAGRYVAAANGDLVGGRDRSVTLRPSSSARGRSDVNLAPGVKDISISRRGAALRSFPDQQASKEDHDV